MPSASLAVEVQLTAGVWTALGTDLRAGEGLRLQYGIESSHPLACVANSGRLECAVRNDAGNTGSQQGWYSPAHASVRAGWNAGIPIRVIFWTGAAASVASLTRTGGTATCRTSAAHGLASGDWVTIAGADQAAYNGTVQIAYVDADEFTYTVTGTPATPATGTITWIRAYVKFRGKVDAIEPEAGRYLRQRVHLTAADAMRDLAEADVYQVGLQTDKTEAELITAVLAAIPTDAQPPATDLDTGVDLFPYAFDDLGSGVKALGVISDVAMSSFALVFARGDGTLRMLSRHARSTAASSYTFNEDMVGLSAPAAVAEAWNRVRVTTHPKTIDATAVEVLYALTGTPPAVGPGETLELWGAYRDPNDVTRSIGGFDIVDPPVAGTDYAGNSAADGSGDNHTADLTVALDPFASTCKFTITNAAAVTVYLVDGSGVTTLQCRGTAVRDDAPQTFEASSAMSYGDRLLAVDMPYQDDPAIGQNAADYLLAQNETLTSKPRTLTFLANASTDVMAQALAREPGDVVTLTETVTGLTLLEAVIHAVALEVRPGPWIVCTWTLASAAPWKFFQWGVTGAAEWGDTTVWGF